MATIQELEREVVNLKSALAQCVLSTAPARQENARVTLVGMGVSGIIFGLAGYLLGSRNGMRHARELIE